MPTVRTYVLGQTEKKQTNKSLEFCLESETIFLKVNLRHDFLAQVTGKILFLSLLLLLLLTLLLLLVLMLLLLLLLELLFLLLLGLFLPLL